MFVRRMFETYCVLDWGFYNTSYTKKHQISLGTYSNLPEQIKSVYWDFYNWADQTRRESFIRSDDDKHAIQLSKSFVSEGVIDQIQKSAGRVDHFHCHGLHVNIHDEEREKHDSQMPLNRTWTKTCLFLDADNNLELHFHRPDDMPVIKYKLCLYWDQETKKVFVKDPQEENKQY